jgi:hypothetical protein
MQQSDLRFLMPSDDTFGGRINFGNLEEISRRGRKLD